MKPLKIAFAGTPAFGLPCLKDIHQSQHNVVAVYTQPDRPSGRGQKLKASPIKMWALEHNIPVYQPANFKQAEAVETLRSLDLDVMVVIAYGLILPESVLNIPRFGCINGHASILPRWRGASPIQRAIQHRDKYSGVTIMQMDKGMDTGDILAVAACDIETDDTGGSLHDKLSLMATKPMLETLEQIHQGSLSPTPQTDDKATYAPKISKQEARIDWHHQSNVIDAVIRAFNPWPVAHTTLNNLFVKIYQSELTNQISQLEPGTITAFNREGLFVSTGDYDLKITRLQLPGKKPVSSIELYNGHSSNWQPGNQFS